MRKPRAPPKGERQRMRYAVVLYTDTTSKEAVADFMERYRRRKQREYRRQQHRWYFIKQRLFGIALLAFTVLAKSRKINGRQPVLSLDKSINYPTR